MGEAEGAEREESSLMNSSAATYSECVKESGRSELVEVIFWWNDRPPTRL
jgi:hypothetical protein